MDDEIVRLLAERPLGKDSLSDWAVKCLEKGFDSYSLRILASMNSSYSPSELDDYLKRSLKELGWDKIEKQEYLLRYAEILAQEIIEDKVDPVEAALEINDILKDLEYPSELQEFTDIDEMICDYEYFLKTGKTGYYFRPKEELISEIKRMSKELLKSKKV